MPTLSRNDGAQTHLSVQRYTLEPVNMSSSSKTRRHTPRYEYTFSFRIFPSKSGVLPAHFHDFDTAQTIIAMEVLYCVGTAAFKYSALLLFHRIFGLVPRFTAVLWCFAFVILANNVAEVFLSIFQCVPVHKAWDREVEGSCVKILLAACIPGAINVVCDVFTVLLPVPLIWTLHMERNRKIQLVGIFLLSGL